MRSAKRQLKLTGNGGNLPILEFADFDGFNKEVWYSEDAITNIMSLSLVKREYSISHDGEDFIFHQAKHDYADMVFKPHPSGLHVYDPDDPWDHANYSFVETVEENMAMFTKHQIVNAKLACKLQAGMAYPFILDLKWVVQSNQIKDCPVTVQDVNIALKTWGPSVALLKGKTVQRTPPVAVQDIVEVQKEIRENHKHMTLLIDIFFVSRVPYFVTLSLRICFFSVMHMTNQKIVTIFKALKATHNFYLQRGFQIVLIKGDGEFKPLVEFMPELYGAPRLNPTSANEHVPEIERKIRVIKKQVRAVMYGMPFNAVPLVICVSAVLFVTKQLNLFPVKGGILANYSPK